MKGFLRTTTLALAILLPGAPSAQTAQTVQPEQQSSPTAPADPAPAATHPKRKRLSGDSSLRQWREASSRERSRVAVALAKTQLPPGAAQLDLATAAMEITGCLTATASDERFAAWQVAATAVTCLTAPEQERKNPNTASK